MKFKIVNIGTYFEYWVYQFHDGKHHTKCGYTRLSHKEKDSIINWLMMNYSTNRLRGFHELF